MGGAQARRKWPPTADASLHTLAGRGDEATDKRLTDGAPPGWDAQKGVGGWRATGAAVFPVRDTIYIPFGAAVVVAVAARPLKREPRPLSTSLALPSRS